MRDYFADTDAPMDFVLFSNYGRQVDALLAGTIDIAWNTNLAWVRTVGQTERRVPRPGDARHRHRLPDRPRRTGRQRTEWAGEPARQTAGTGIPGLRPGGDPARALPAARPGSDPTPSNCCASTATSASTATPAEASSTPSGRSWTDAQTPPRIGINTWESIGRDELMPGAFEAFWTSPTYSHCNFTALPGLGADRADPWVAALFAMDWENPQHREVLEMEGLRRWVPPELDGYRSLFEAVEKQGISLRW